MLVERELDQHDHFLVVDPRFVRRLHARPRPAAAAVDLAALHRHDHVVAARIAFDDLEMRAQNAVEHARELIGVGAGAGAADGELLGEQVLEFGDAGILQRHADADLVVGAAEPVELDRVELIAFADQERIEGDAAAEGGEHRAILRRHAIEPVGEAQAAGAFHVARYQGRIAGNMRAHVAADHAGIEVIGAAGRVADIFVDIAVFVEIGRALLRGGETRGPEREQRSGNGNMILRKSHDPPRNALECAGVPRYLRQPMRQCNIPARA